MSDTGDLAVVIMAGGAGTRFWPLSTEQRPKQFLNLFGEHTLLQQSYRRVEGLVPPERVLVLTNQRFVSQVCEQLPEIPRQNIIGEPLRRDTAAAVALAALLCRRRFGNPAMAVLTSDHLIQPVDRFHLTLLSAVRAVGTSEGAEALYTFGIHPSYPATGYGYLQRGEKVLTDQGIEHYELLKFREKPDRRTAERYLDSGQFLWNSGMFVWSTEAILAELAAHLPNHLEQLEPALEHDGTPAFDEALGGAFEALQPISIDFGVMEKARRVRCVASGFDWSDVGGWPALEGLLEQDATANSHRCRLFVQGAGHNLVFCEDRDEVVALVGVDDLVVVRAGNRTLVVRRDSTEQIKQLVKDLPTDLK